MYSTSNEHTRIPWGVHTYNVAFSDEIGHFEYCNNANAKGICASAGANAPKKDSDDTFCFNPKQSLLVQIGGCQFPDYDFDGVAYQPTWQGTLPDPVQDQRLHAESFLFTSPLTGGQNYDRLAFEADLPTFEFFVGCHQVSGDGCTNPPLGAQFYPIYSTRTGRGACGWQEGGTFIQGTSNTFGGTSSSEYGPILGVHYAPFPQFNFPILFEDFHNTLASNPCASTGRLPT
jgi:hypothetical protein